MTLRDKCGEKKLNAHRILDLVRAGVKVDAKLVTAALAALGEPVGE